jgi:hypothetical protein
MEVSSEGFQVSFLGFLISLLSLFDFLFLISQHKNLHSLTTPIFLVGSSNFVEARVGAGDVAVYASPVNASMQGFHVLFDYLEWTEGEKLSACCHTPGRQPIELYCPFESTTNETDIRWQSERIRCEPETQRACGF